MNDTTPQPVSVAKYIWWMLGIQALCALLLGGFELISGVELPSVTGFVGMLLGAYMAAQKFAGDHGREVVPAERHRFARWVTIGSFPVYALIFLILFTAAAGIDGYRDLLTYAKTEVTRWGLVITIGLIVAVVAALLTYGLSYWLFGFYVRTFVKKLAKPAAV